MDKRAQAEVEVLLSGIDRQNMLLKNCERCFSFLFVVGIVAVVACQSYFESLVNGSVAAMVLALFSVLVCEVLISKRKASLKSDLASRYGMEYDVGEYIFIPKEPLAIRRSCVADYVRFEDGVPKLRF